MCVVCVRGVCICVVCEVLCNPFVPTCVLVCSMTLLSLTVAGYSRTAHSLYVCMCIEYSV